MGCFFKRINFKCRNLEFQSFEFFNITNFFSELSTNYSILPEVSWNFIQILNEYLCVSNCHNFLYSISTFFKNSFEIQRSNELLLKVTHPQVYARN